LPLPRHCLGCHVLIPSGSRCGSCAPVAERRRGNTTQRGYGAAWQRISARVVKTYGACVRCGTTGSKDNPLTADHIVPKSKGGTDDEWNLECLCRKCNSAKHNKTLGAASAPRNL